MYLPTSINFCIIFKPYFLVKYKMTVISLVSQCCIILWMFHLCKALRKKLRIRWSQRGGQDGRVCMFRETRCHKKLRGRRTNFHRRGEGQGFLVRKCRCTYTHDCYNLILQITWLLYAIHFCFVLHSTRLDSCSSQWHLADGRST